MNKNRLQQAISRFIKDEISKRHEPKTGIIKKYNESKNTATVQINDSRSGGTYTVRNVPIKIEKGFANYSVNINDKVLVSFHDGDIDTPYVSMIYDNNYENNTREDKKAANEGPSSNSSLPYRQNYESPEDKRYMENGRIGIIHPTHKSTFRLNNRNGDADIIASNGIGTEDPISRAAIRVRSEGFIQSIAGRIDNYADQVNMHTKENGVVINGYPLNQEMAEASQIIGKRLQCVMATPENVHRLVAAINTIPGTQGFIAEGIAPYNQKLTTSLGELAERAETVMEKWFPGLGG